MRGHAGQTVYWRASTFPARFALYPATSEREKISVNQLNKELATVPDTAILMRKPAKKSSNRPVAHEPVGDGVVATKRNPKQSK